uniref:Uncharacterized protein n=1 Tax=Compsopogon caeruleus TaxID=31354 RepID=A0A7S1TD39_9RHOD|mmetsp:Transcript_17266/g.35865  ORF Transcript_17266/g.35865 Transcript_17266/m.35865 type:complete len:191 (+) Transcript_17266:44-616(+)
MGELVLVLRSVLELDGVARKWLLQERFAEHEMRGFSVARDVLAHEWRFHVPEMQWVEVGYSSRLFLSQYHVGTWVLGVVVMKNSEVFLKGLPLTVPAAAVVVGRFALDLTRPNDVTEIVRLSEDVSYINCLREFSPMVGFAMAESYLVRSRRVGRELVTEVRTASMETCAFLFVCFFSPLSSFWGQETLN